MGDIDFWDLLLLELIVLKTVGYLENWSWTGIILFPIIMATLFGAAKHLMKGKESDD